MAREIIKRGLMLSAVVEEVRARFCCAYCDPSTGRGGDFCDCKYGADKLGQHHEAGNGCPELREVVGILSMLTNKEIKALAKKFQKHHKRVRDKEQRARARNAKDIGYSG